MSCENTLANTHGINYFKSFLAKEFSGKIVLKDCSLSIAENLEFWVEINQFKNLTEEDMVDRRAKEIYAKYFKVSFP
jgi:hypothetical protein